MKAAATAPPPTGGPAAPVVATVVPGPETAAGAGRPTGGVQLASSGSMAATMAAAKAEAAKAVAAAAAAAAAAGEKQAADGGAGTPAVHPAALQAPEPPVSCGVPAEVLPVAPAQGPATATAVHSAAAVATPTLETGCFTKTCYFTLDTPDSTPPPSPRTGAAAAEGGAENGDCLGSACLMESGCDPERHHKELQELSELQRSRAKFHQAVQEQQEVEESVTSLLRRLDQLPAASKAAPVTPAAKTLASSGAPSPAVVAAAQAAAAAVKAKAKAAQAAQLVASVPPPKPGGAAPQLQAPAKTAPPSLTEVPPMAAYPGAPSPLQAPVAPTPCSSAPHRSRTPPRPEGAGNGGPPVIASVVALEASAAAQQTSCATETTATASASEGAGRASVAKDSWDAFQLATQKHSGRGKAAAAEPAMQQPAPPLAQWRSKEAPAKDEWGAFVVASKKHKQAQAESTRAAGPAPGAASTPRALEQQQQQDAMPTPGLTPLDVSLANVPAVPTPRTPPSPPPGPAPALPGKPPLLPRRSVGGHGGKESPVGAATPPQVGSPRVLPAMPKTPPGGRSVSGGQGAQLGQSVPADRSLLPRHGDATATDAGAEEPWRDWTIQTSRDGRLFYHHTPTNASQWQMPPELTPVLGEWVLVPATEDGDEYWRNELLGLSSWTDPRGTTSLFQAALDGNLFFLQLYAEVGGFLDSVDASGRTALHYSCAGGSMHNVLHLLQGGASLDIQDQTGSTPLHWACRYGHAPIVRTLLEAYADPNCRNALGDTCMHEAAALGRADALQLLIEARADPSLRNRESRTPLDVAYWSQAADAVALLSDSSFAGYHNEYADETDMAMTPRENVMPMESLDSNPVFRPKPRRQSYDNDSSSEDDGDEPEPSLALTAVRAARPLLRSVQWLANRVLGEKKTDLGTENSFRFDPLSRQWVLKKQRSERLHKDLGASDSSDGSGSEDDMPRLSPLAARLSRSRFFRSKAPGMESDGTVGV